MPAAAKLAGVTKVVLAEGDAYAHDLAEPLAALIGALAPSYDAFVAPATLATAAATLLGAWPLDIWVAAAIMGLGGFIITWSMLRRAMGGDLLPELAAR